MTLDLFYFPLQTTPNKSSLPSVKIKKDKGYSHNLLSQAFYQGYISVYETLNDLTSVMTSGSTAPKSYLDLDSEVFNDSSLMIRRHVEYKMSLTDVSTSFVNNSQSRIGLMLGYLSGELDIPDLVNEFNELSEGDVVVILEKMGIHRNILKNTISAEEEFATLSRLANIDNEELNRVYNSQNWIRREVVASQRIESVVVALKDFE